MHIKDHNDAMTFFRNSKQLESNGKWKEFVEESKFDDMLQESRPMAQEPRMGLQGGQLVAPSVDGSRPGYNGEQGGKKVPQQGFQKGNVWYKQNIGKYKTDEERLNSLRKTLTNLDEGTTLNVNQLHKSTGISRRTIDNILEREYKNKFEIPGMGKAQSLNIEKLNKAKQEKALGEFNKIKKPYSKDLIEKYKFPSGSPEALSNADLAKKYFGKVNVATIARVERLNNKLAKELNLSYPKGDETTYAIKRKKRLSIVQGGKYIGGSDAFPFHHIMQIGGETDITTKDVAIISKQMNSKLGPYNKKLNDIADAVSNLYTERPEGFQKRVDELQKNAEQIINKVKKELPKKYQGLVGFTKLEPIYDEYGTILRLQGKRIGIDESKSIASATGKTEKIGEMTGERLSEFKKQIEKISKDRGIKLRKGEAGFIATDILKDAGKLGKKGLRLLSSEWVWPEIVIGWLDKQNNIQKGMSEERASSEMWKTVTFGLWDKGGTENAILEQAKELGYGEKDIKALENIMRYGKLSKEIKDTEVGIESMEKGYTPFSSEKGAQQLKEKLENLKKEQESVVGFYFGAIGDKDASYGYEIYDQASKELMRTEWNRSLEGRKKRTDPYAGEIGSQTGEVLGMTPGWYETQEKMAAMSPQELELFNMERGIGEEKVHPLYGAGMSYKQMEPLRDQLGYMYAGGGIASLKKW